MPLDPNIILAGQNKQFDPTEALTKAMTMKQLALQSQQMQQQVQDKQDLRDAYKRNTLVDANGNPVVNKQGVLSDLLKLNPEVGNQLQSQFLKTDLDQNEDYRKILGLKVGQILPDMSNYKDIRQQLVDMKYPNANMLPEEPNAKIIENLRYHSLTPEEQIKHEDVGLKREELNSKKHNDYVQHVEDSAKGFRNDPAALRASTMLAAAASGKAMLDRYRGHEDDMPINDIHTLITDKLKAISGVAPTAQDIEAQLPHTIRTQLGGLQSYVTGKPAGAGAGDYVRQTDQVFREMEKSARGILEKRQKEITSNPRLTDEEKQRISGMAIPDQIYKPDDSSASQPGKTFKTHEIDWAE